MIEIVLSRLAKITNCVRSYSTDFGLDQIAGIAARHGLKVMQGLWLSSHPDKNRDQIETAVALANRYPETIRAVVVGNEVLLRGEMTATDLAATMRAVKARVPVPVTYADVWEFWLRNRDVAAAADFITIHILPYWEDFPIPARNAAAHVEAIRRRVVAAFAGKEVIIGEVGWPSAGRMREGALPSPANQARVIQDVLALGLREKFRVNVIEAFDAPWKRALEGTVGGHWGLLDDASRQAKFAWGQPVSDHPWWRWQAAGGIAFAVLVFGAAMLARGGAAPLMLWLAVSANATAGGISIGWTWGYDRALATNNTVELVIRRFDQHYQNFCGFESIESAQLYLGVFEKLYRFTPFSQDAQLRIRGKSPLQLAGYDVSRIPMATLCSGMSIDWPTEISLVPN